MKSVPKIFTGCVRHGHRLWSSELLLVAVGLACGTHCFPPSSHSWSGHRRSAIAAYRLAVLGVGLWHTLFSPHLVIAGLVIEVQPLLLTGLLFWGLACGTHCFPPSSHSWSGHRRSAIAVYRLAVLGVGLWHTLFSPHLVIAGLVIKGQPLLLTGLLFWGLACGTHCFPPSSHSWSGHRRSAIAAYRLAVLGDRALFCDHALPHSC